MHKALHSLWRDGARYADWSSKKRRSGFFDVAKIKKRKFIADENFRQLDPVYPVSQEEMRNAIFLSLQKAHLV